MDSGEKRAIVITVSAAGLLALAVRFFEGYLWVPVEALLGDRWRIRVIHGLIDLGFSEAFVAGYVSFLLLHVPVWCVLVPVTFGLELSSRRVAKAGALAFTVWLPVMDIVTDVWGYFAYVKDAGFPGVTTMQFLFGFNIRIVPALVTVAMGFLAWGGADDRQVACD